MRDAMTTARYTGTPGHSEGSPRIERQNASLSPVSEAGHCRSYCLSCRFPRYVVGRDSGKGAPGPFFGATQEEDSSVREQVLKFKHIVDLANGLHGGDKLSHLDVYPVYAPPFYPAEGARIRRQTATTKGSK